MSIIEEHPLRLNDEVLPSEYFERSGSVSSEDAVGDSHDEEGEGEETIVDKDASNDSHVSTVRKNSSFVADTCANRTKSPVCDHTSHKEDPASLSQSTVSKFAHTSVRPIEEEVEPSLMQRAAEFSLFEPSQLYDVMNRESIMARLNVYEQNPTTAPGNIGGSDDGDIGVVVVMVTSVVVVMVTLVVVVMVTW